MCQVPNIVQVKCSSLLSDSLSLDCHDEGTITWVRLHDKHALHTADGFASISCGFDQHSAAIRIWEEVSRVTGNHKVRRIEERNYPDYLGYSRVGLEIPSFNKHSAAILEKAEGIDHLAA